MKKMYQAIGLVILMSVTTLPLAMSCQQKTETVQTTSTQPGDAASTGDVFDLKAAAILANSDQYPSPGTKWRSGHANPMKNPPKPKKREGMAFEIKVPSNAQVVTPTFADGLIYYSGGFNSKVFFCSDAATGETVWAVHLDDDGPSNAVVEDGIVVFNTESCTIFALDAKTGKHIWSWWLGDPLMSSPTVKDGKVYTAYPAPNGPILNLKPGQQPEIVNSPNKPVKKTEDVPATSPNLAQPVVTQNQLHQLPPNGQVQQLQGSGFHQAPRQIKEGQMYHSHVMACFDLKTGKVLWQKWIDADVMTAPVATDEGIMVTTLAGTVYRFDENNGNIELAQRTNATSVVVANGKQLYYSQRVVSKDGEVRETQYEVDGVFKKARVMHDQKAEYLEDQVQAKSQQGQNAQKMDAGNGFAQAPMSANLQQAQGTIGLQRVSSVQAFEGSRPLVWNNQRFAMAGDRLICMDNGSGEQLWESKLRGDLKKLGGRLGTAPVMVGGELILATTKGEILRINPEDGSVIKTYETGAQLRVQPIVMHGRIYVGTTDGRVLCVDTGNKKLTGWSTWGADSQRSGQAK